MVSDRVVTDAFDVRSPMDLQAAAEIDQVAAIAKAASWHQLSTLTTAKLGVVKELCVSNNHLSALPAEIGQLATLTARA